MSGSLRIVIGITGGIAAYKIPLLIRLLKKHGAEVKVVCTKAATSLVGTEALRTLSRNPVYLDGEYTYDMDHIRLAEWGNLLLIAPATANTIAKIANGIADNVLTSLALSFREESVMVAPAMNTVMWESKVTQSNCKLLASRGITVLPVDIGELACNVVGAGRMIDIERIADFAIAHCSQGTLLKGKRVLISSGPTEEAIDPVRVITNKSSGKMGAALAREALRLGAEVTVVSGPASEPLPYRAQVIKVKSASEMKNALEQEFPQCDICIMAAAVSDYRPKVVSADKLPRNENGSMVLELVSNPDIIAGLVSTKKHQFITGFSLESGDGEERARAKMERKGCDMMVFNRADEALGSDSTRIVLLGRNGFRKESGPISKSEAAREILEHSASLSSGV